MQDPQKTKQRNLHGDLQAIESTCRAMNIWVSHFNTERKDSKNYHFVGSSGKLLKNAWPCSSKRISSSVLRPWPNDRIFLSILSSTFDLKVERLFSVVEHMWPNGAIFRSTF